MKDFFTLEPMLSVIHIVLYVVYLLVFLIIIQRLSFFKSTEIGTRKWQLLFLLKVTAGIILTCIYTFYYTNPARADIYRYFNDSCIISNVLMESPRAWFYILCGINLNDPETFSYLVHTQNFSHPATDFVTNNTFIIRVNVLLNYLSFQNIFINTLFFSFFSFCGMVALFKAFKNYFANTLNWFLFPFFIYPSVVFWSSGLLKESLFFAAFGFWVHSVSTLRNSNRYILSFMLLLFTSWIMFSVKAQAFFVLLLSAYCWLLLEKKGAIRAILGGIPLALAAVAVAVVPDLLSKLCETVLDKRNEFIALALTEKSGSLLHNVLSNTDCSSFAQLIPLAVFDALFQPLITGSRNIFELAFALENSLVIILLAFLLFHFKAPSKTLLPAIVFCFAFAFLNLILIGITATINGAIVHYRIVGMPFLLVAFFACADINKIKSLFIRTPIKAQE